MKHARDGRATRHLDALHDGFNRFAGIPNLVHDQNALGAKQRIGGELQEGWGVRGLAGLIVVELDGGDQNVANAQPIAQDGTRNHAAARDDHHRVKFLVAQAFGNSVHHVFDVLVAGALFFDAHGFQYVTREAETRSRRKLSAMPQRTKTQWLEMIQRTRPTGFAIKALKTEFARHVESDGLTESDVHEIRAALEKLSLEVDETPLDAPSPTARPQASVEYQPHGSGGKGRLFLEIEDRTQLEPLENPALDELKVYVMTDGSRFAGVQVDDATQLPPRLEVAIDELDALELPVVDCVEAGLEAARISDVLAWAVQNRVLARR